MNFVAVTYGTEGDTRPMALLCRALIDAGHSAHLLADATTLGTAHAAARAGVPSVVVPFAGDQFFWADRLCQAGAAPVPVPAKGLSADRLARAIDAANESAPRASAVALGASIAREDGLGTAVTAIKALMRRDV